MRANAMFLGLAAVAVAVSSASAQRVDRARVNEYGRRTADGPNVQVWIDRYSYSDGERIRAFFQAEEGSYVTVLRVTSRGDVKVLYPHTPTIQRAFTSDQLVDDEIPYATDAAMYLNEPSGVGFVFAIASYTPFNYRSVTSGGRWSTLQLASNRYEDAFTVVNRFLTRTLPRQADYSVDYIEYQVSGGGNRVHRPYANSATYSGLSYGDLYFQCLQYYGAQAAAYCRSYAQFGGAAYGFGAGPGRAPTPVATGGKTAIQPKMHPPTAYIPDPVVTGRFEPRAPQPDPTGTEVEVIRSTPRDGGKADGGNHEAARRAEPIDVSPGSRYEPAPREPQYQAPREPQYQPAPQRYEPAPQPRVEPAPVGSMPRYEAPVVRSEPRVMPTPRPAPPPSPPPAPAPSPVSAPAPIPVVPPSAPPAVDH